MSKNTYRTPRINYAKLQLHKQVTVAVAELAGAAREGLLALEGRGKTETDALVAAGLDLATALATVNTAITQLQAMGVSEGSMLIRW